MDEDQSALNQGDWSPRPYNLYDYSVCARKTPQVNEGSVDVDQSALTGESLPVTICAGEPAMMGGTIVRGEVLARLLEY